MYSDVEQVAVLNLDLVQEKGLDAFDDLAKIKGALFQVVIVSAQPESQRRAIAMQLFDAGVFLTNPDKALLKTHRNVGVLPYLVLGADNPVAAIAPLLAWGTIKHVLFAGYGTSALAAAEGQGYTVQAVATLEQAQKAAKEYNRAALAALRLRVREVLKQRKIEEVALQDLETRVLQSEYHELKLWKDVGLFQVGKGRPGIGDNTWYCDPPHEKVIYGDSVAEVIAETAKVYPEMYSWLDQFNDR